jgi:hypothetical protein
MKKQLPKIGQQVSTPMGIASVIESNPLKGTVTVEMESQARVELPLSEVTSKDKYSHKQKKVEEVPQQEE